MTRSSRRAEETGLAKKPTSPNGPPAPDQAALALAPIQPLDIIDELRESYLTYAQSVIISRALPDVRDGLKPSQRRILVAMNDLGLGPTSSTTKCASIVGETMKRYHPHGEATIYPTLVRMAQEWAMRQRLVHPQGNFGSIAGLPAAAMRYTEARLNPAAAEMLADLECETVDFIDSYDGKHREPLVLPGRFPNLLVNGATGIAVGMATKVPPHNLIEVCNGLIALIDDPGLSMDRLLEIIPGPDYPTGNIVMGRQGLIRGYMGEPSRITLRARAEVIEEGKGKSPYILIREVPYEVNRNGLAENIGNLVRDGRIEGVSSIRDESSARSGEPVRLIVELKRGADPHLVLNQLYQFSDLQKTVPVAMLALVDGRPQFLSLKEMMRKFLDHRVQVIRRRTQFLLREAKQRGHILEGQLIAISSLDEVIRIIRGSPSRADAKVQLQEMKVAATVMSRAIGEAAFAALQAELGKADVYQMTEAQAEAILRMQLGQLANLERDEILKEYNQLRGQIREYEAILADDGRVNTIIRKDLEAIRDRFGTPRLTEISDDGGDLDMEDLIADEQMVVMLSHEGFIKRLPVDTYRTQGRGGKGVQGGLRENDFIQHFFTASTKSYLLCFTDRGQCYWLRVYKIPEASRTSPGRSIANVLQLKEGEKIASVIPVREFEEGAFLLMATRSGVVKKTSLMEYSRPRQGGIIGISLDENDKLIDVCLTRPGDEVMLSTRQGMAIRFDQADVRAMGRGATGVRGIKVNEANDDAVVGMVVADPDGYLLTLCENGFGKRTPFGANTVGDVSEEEEDVTVTPLPKSGETPNASEGVSDTDDGTPNANEGGADADRSAMRYRKQRRGGKGVKDVKVTAKNGPVVGIASVRDGDEIMVITQQGMVVRTRVDAIRTVGRNTQGVKVMTPNEGDKVATMAKLVSEEKADFTTEDT
jgi:DNA gyrase subunit A